MFLTYKALEFRMNTGTLNVAGKTHLRFAIRTAQATSNLAVQCSPVEWTSIILKYIYIYI